ncbi:hypothetical protein A3H89_02575 [Candidatus Amesbacteria bacterium RIFCSPLOWO2_02_FULL_48_11]|uniref:DUF1573 domain-containing protein n=4 Tax=Candidatus Amesiibacteriota TaxID=1752730 RepID=A0A1F4ZBI5_9BACT|nr:MAG: hypothetical protein UX78_C0015G0029 [Candidatus Amesbacteria bacterium GW2011_GWA2_47_11]KKU90686.1 MAG: hypothetical protein UY22_C0051G0008 [Candidatus Amesbacteria bacterium GW2011_GWC1_48_10]KKU99704.1 MAG: hypothetical protein UY33_C0024G0009 [Candidatus Amesbacteria bacterium GW2011_GWA1_48_9]OGC89903.1 MAG: hypothetical protein A2V48_01720 [Candidatus Amesbacteria bacterium RBG_19FT_COMBO_48_16]OGC95660.1 MAG: hypothetical protein A3C34_02300 [Candidatus Amesbacteria bacterium R
MNPKIIIAVIISSLGLVIGGVVLASRLPTNQKAEVVKDDSAKLFVDHQNYDWQNINYSGGVVTHSFPVGNQGTAPLTVANMKTSCMCTTVKLISTSGTSPAFAMHQQSDWKGTVQPGETAQLEIVFDPAFHGPQGVGPMERIISLETSDPLHPYVEFNLKGEVTKS